MTKIESLRIENKKHYLEAIIFGLITLGELGILIYIPMTNALMTFSCILIFLGLGISSVISVLFILMNNKEISELKMNEN